jgi:VWFA-related protein
MLRLSTAVLILGVVLVGTASNTSGQGSDVPKSFFPIFVSTKKDGFLTNLTARDFEIRENGKPIEIVSLARSDAPFVIGIIIDFSGSMSDGPNRKAISKELRTALSDLSKFIDLTHPESSYLLSVINNNDISVSAPTQDRTRIKLALDELTQRQTGGNTRLYEAIRVTTERLGPINTPRKVILMITDGWDNDSRGVEFADVKRLVRRESIVLYGIILSDAGNAGSVFGPRAAIAMNTLCSVTGGRYFRVADRDKALDWSRMLRDELASAYQVDIRAPEGGRKQTWRELKVRLTAEAKTSYKDASIRARKGVVF